jgi:modulator of FtsH protease
VAYDPAGWQNFYVMTGGAAAALTGLLFVAMSMHAKAIMAHTLLGGRAIGTLISLLTQLAIAGAILVPGQPVQAIGIEIEVAAVFWVAFLAATIFRARAHVGPSDKRSPLRVAVESIGGSIWIVLFLASGLSLIARVGGGFYVLAIVMLFMFGWNVYVSWVLITVVSD